MNTTYRIIYINSMELSNEQKYALEKFKQGHNLFITGPGGTGKSKLIKDFVIYCYKIKKSVQVTALTGCAAILLGHNAKTIHSWSGIKLCRGEPEKIVEQILSNKRALKNWKSIKVLIIDEVSMMSAKMFDVLNRIGKMIRRSDQPFGGIQIILTGDFYQLPPIENKGEPESGKFCFQSLQWNTTFPYENQVVLSKIFRQKDQTYINILNEIRTGELTDENIKLLRTYVNRSYNKEEHNGVSLTKLYPVKNSVDVINSSMFKALPDETKDYILSVHKDNLMYGDTKKPIESHVLEMCKDTEF